MSWYSEHATPIGWCAQITQEKPSERRSEGRVRLRRVQPVPAHLVGRGLSEIQQAICPAQDDDERPWPAMLDGVLGDPGDAP